MFYQQFYLSAHSKDRVPMLFLRDNSSSFVFNSHFRLLISIILLSLLWLYFLFHQLWYFWRIMVAMIESIIFAIPYNKKEGFFIPKEALYSIYFLFLHSLLYFLMCLQHQRSMILFFALLNARKMTHLLLVHFFNSLYRFVQFDSLYLPHQSVDEGMA